MNKVKHKAEILSPCGSFESLIAALRTGCDAVYVGGKSLSARQGADNFSQEEIIGGAKLCHRYGVKIYQAINTVFTDGETELVVRELENACKAGIDGIIVQDLGVFEIARRLCPTLPLHASTQMAIHSPMGVDFAKEIGAVRAVAARELSREEISELCKCGLEIEAFVHGALCMCLSGQCYMSAMIGSRSANRGRCAQACRLPFSNGIPVEKGGRDYALSLKDLSLVPYLKELEEIGVASLKIEGRMKRPEYVAAATDACRRSIEGEDYDVKTLEGVFSRSGFTDGYYTAKRRDMFGTRRKEDVIGAKELLKPLAQLYRKERKMAGVSFFVEIKRGKEISLEITDGENSAVVSGGIPQEAISRETDLEACAKQLSKLGDTIYEFEEVRGDIEPGLSVSAGDLNDLRRKAVARLDSLREQANTGTIPFDRSALPATGQSRRWTDKKEFVLKVAKASRLRMIDFHKIKMAVVPIEEIGFCHGFDMEKTAVSLPRFITDEKALEDELEEAVKNGVNKVFASNYAHIMTAKKMGLEFYCDHTLNVTNSYAVKVLEDMGAKGITCSAELKFSQINSLNSDVPVGITGYGRLPLMITRNCPIGDCSRCKGEIVDRTKRAFPVKCSKKRGYTEVLNSDILYTADKLHEVNCDYVILDFYDEDPEQVKEILEKYISGSPFEKPFTRGLYFRGII